MFEDHYSHKAEGYSRFRPTYPDELYQFIVSHVARRERAWDCATGSGQAARHLAASFQEVVATDASSRQLAHAPAHPRIRYLRTLAEDTPFEPGSFDLVTVATAVHWLDQERFYAEVRRVARPDALLAVWSYSTEVSTGTGVDAVMARFSDEILRDAWTPGFWLARDRYRSLPFPFEELPGPEFSVRVRWTLRDLEGWVDTWSAVSARRRKGVDPVPELLRELAAVWPESRSLDIELPLGFRLGRV
ncbi:MAG: class I SAM-dependent methyltransferase [Armatimonadetes bacterium]|nr:class I SAM-dependent methyltransferase [Armatimonadota bacterium]